MDAISRIFSSYFAWADRHGDDLYIARLRDIGRIPDAVP
jgi:hypothetical protein